MEFESLTRVQILSDTMGLLTNTRGSGAPPALAPPNANPPWSMVSDLNPPQNVGNDLEGGFEATSGDQKSFSSSSSARAT